MSGLDAGTVEKEHVRFSSTIGDIRCGNRADAGVVSKNDINVFNH
jgi:hypothetical protein